MTVQIGSHECAAGPPAAAGGGGTGTIMIARFDKAAKDEVEAEELAGEGHGLWTARVNPKTQARVGRTMDLAVDTSGFHFFDKDTGLAIGHPDINTTDGNGSAALRSV